MAATGETQMTNSSSVEGEDVFTDDPRSDGKKKKFKPFQKMKNFFRGGSKKRKVDEGDAPPMFRSTGALHHKAGEGEDDDEGGFRRKGLAGSRSISEDSVFQPEAKETAPIGVLKGQAVSMEAINTGFQAELLSKLKLRQSDSDLDEGLPYSPMPVLSPSSHMFRSRTMSEPTPEGTMQQDSQQSLISVDGSDEDLFSNNWKSGVASVKTRGSSGSEKEREMEVSDFEHVQMSSSYLSNEAAKHRISVKPKSRRLSSKVSMKKEKKPTIPVLADVKEESPTAPDSQPASRQIDEQPTGTKPITIPQKTVISTTIPIGSPPKTSTGIIPARTEPQDIPQPWRAADESRINMARSLSPVSTSPVSKAALDEVKLKARPLSGKFEGVELKREPLQSQNELSKAFNRAKRISRKYDEDGNIVDNAGVSVSNKQAEVKKESEVVIPASQKEEVQVSIGSATIDVPTSAPVASKAQSSPSPVSPGVSGVSFVLKKEPLRPGSKNHDKPSSTIEPNNSGLADTVSKDSDQLVKDIEPVKKDVVTVSGVKSDSSVSVGKIGSPEKLASPREDYLIKRHSRSKTLPVSKELGNKDEIGGSPKTQKLGSPLLRNKSDENVAVGSPSKQSKRASWAPESAAGSTSSEPAWMRNRLKKLEQDNQNKEVKLEIKRESSVETKAKNFVAEKTDDKPEKEIKLIEKPPVSSSIKLVIEKNSSGPTIRSWGQQSVKATPTQASAKPFEKASANQTDTSKNLSDKTSASPTKSNSTNQNTNIKPADFKPSVSSAKTASPSSTANKLQTQSARPPVSSVTKPVSDKPLSQSVRAGGLDSKFSQFGGKVGGSVQPLSQSVRVSPASRQAMGTSANAQKTDSDKSSNTPDTKRSLSQDNNKQEIDSKLMAKQSKVFEKPKPAAVETSSSKVPAWRQALSQRKTTNPLAQQVKIEIIDKEPEKPPEKRVDQKPAVEMREKPKAALEKCSDGNRSSKVLDLVKNYQKLQVT